MTTRLVGWVFWSLGFGLVGCDLVVNVRNQGGETYKQTILANLTDETVTLNFDGHDGSETVMVIDFRNEIQLVHVIRLGDQEENDLGSFDQRRRGKIRNEDGVAVYKSYCFVTKFKANEFIPVDAMAKLRQKNPWSLRTPERNEPPQNISFDIMLDATASDWISPSIPRYCVGESGFSVSTYAVKMEISEKAVNPEDFIRSVRDVRVDGDKGCWEGGGGDCVCSSYVCIGWYPCALKFCRTRSSSGSSNGTSASGTSTGGPDNFKTYRCGIHTCRVCRSYFFGVRSAKECV